MTIGEKILNLRKARGWSQEELAEQIGVSRQAVSRWESDSAKPDADKIIAICDLFGVSADYLLRDIERKEKDAMEPTVQKNTAVTRKKSSMTWMCINGLISFTVGSLLICFFVHRSGFYQYSVTQIIWNYTYTRMIAYLRGMKLMWLYYIALGCIGYGMWSVFLCPAWNKVRKWRKAPKDKISDVEK